MAYRVETSRDFDRAIAKMAPEPRERILRYLKDLDGIEDPRSKGRALTGPLSGFWRYRIGDYRVICEIDEGRLVVIALIVGHRGDIYRKKR